MQTQIIKLNSLKASISSLFQNLSSKSKSSKDYDVTVIVKQSQSTTSNNSQQIGQQSKKAKAVEFIDNPFVINQEMSQSYISLNDNINTFKSIKTQKSIYQNNPPKATSKLRFKKKQDKQNCDPIHDEPKARMIQVSAQTEQRNMANMATEIRIEDEQPDSQKYSCKVNNRKLDSQNSEDNSEEEDEADGGFLIQNYLNQAVAYTEQSQMQKLQDFLYKFKEKYSFINIRVQTKWSLLMGYCKETKLEFERAATNYSQVINNVLQNPLMMTIDIADVYCRLGRCFFEIKQWNRAIHAYCSSLSIYKKNKKTMDYSNCISNLGVLYLQINYCTQAEKCFLIAFNIRRSEGDKKDKKFKINLLQSYFHLFDCNLKLRNLLQCQQIIGNISTIIEQEQQHVTVENKIRYYIKCGKFLFFQGKFQFCSNYYHHALNLFKKHEIDNQEHAEVLQLIGLLKQEEGDLEQCHFFYDQAYDVLKRHVPNESTKLSVLKKKLQYVNQVLLKSRQNSKSKLGNKTMIMSDSKCFGDLRDKKRNETTFPKRSRLNDQ